MTQNVFEANIKTQLKSQITIRNSKDILVWLNKIEELFFFLPNTAYTLICKRHFTPIHLLSSENKLQVPLMLWISQHLWDYHQSQQAKKRIH